jgi:16S rRNA G966 N2-methylase RsmD
MLTCSMNDDNKNKKIYIDRLFPNVNDLKLNYKLKIDEESIMYITIPNDAEQITKIVVNHISQHVPDYRQINVTDICAGVGGNTISFARKFNNITAIELNQERFNYLTNNISAYGITNVKLYHGNCLDIVPMLHCNDIIFIDPPWGGKRYKDRDEIRLMIGQQEIEDVCLTFLNQEKMQSVPKLVVMKLPKNYDIAYLYKKINSLNSPRSESDLDGHQQKINKIYYYQLSKMTIIVIENCCLSSL